MNKTTTSILGLLILVQLSILGCKDTPKETTEPNTPEETTSDYPLESEECSHLCGGPACNQACENDVIYYCQTDDTWHVEEDCAAQGKTCAATEPDTADGAYMLYCE